MLLKGENVCPKTAAKDFLESFRGHKNWELNGSWGTGFGEMTVIYGYVCSFSGVVMNTMIQHSLQKKEFIVAHGSRGLRAHCAWEAWQKSSRHVSRKLRGLISTSSTKQRVNWEWGEAMNYQTHPTPQRLTSSSKPVPPNPPPQSAPPTVDLLSL